MKPRQRFSEPAIITLLFLAGLAQAGWFITSNFITPTFVDDLFIVSGFLRGFTVDVRFSSLKGAKADAVISLLSLIFVIVLWTRSAPRVHTRRV